MFANLRLRYKLLLSFLVLAVIPLVILGLICLKNAGDSLESLAFNQLESIREIKRKAVEDYLRSVHDQMVTFAEDRMIVEALPKFLSALMMTPSLCNMPTSVPTPTRLVPSTCSMALKIRAAMLKFTGRSIRSSEITWKSLAITIYLLVDSESGDIIYSVFKELDYSTSLKNGPYADTNFAEAFRKANSASKRDVIVVDYERYTPTYEAPAGFIASPVYDGNRKLGVAIFQFPIDLLNSIMTQRDGLGETGESYLVGDDLLMRSDSYLAPNTHTVQGSALAD